MQVAIRKMGNSQGILIPKPILAQIGLESMADLQVKNGVIEIRPLKRNPREGWAQDSQRIAQANDDKLVWPEFGSEGDAELVW
jgi:antitoxin MazE